MDYEKEYKEALKRAREYHNVDKDNTLKLYAKGTMEYLFPVLKEESEDEKIRKALIDYFDNANKVDENPLELYGTHTDKVLAWLEKQGEQKSKKEVDNLHNYLYGEQKPADKIESKFNVGDRIVDNCGYTWKIGGILNQFYILEGVEGGESRPTIKWVDKTCHLWTLKDAKDGDVLVDEDNNIGLYRGEKDDFWESYFYLGCDNNLYGFNIGGYHEYKNTKPATKEQRDLFFQKIRERGYEWDTEKKELRVIDWSKHIKYEPNSPSITKENPAWSEEDEEMFDAIIADIQFTQKAHNNEINQIVFEREIDWLNSLKERFNLQSKQEWSEEDKANLLDVKCIIDEIWHCQYVRGEIDRSCEELESLWCWLDDIWQKVEYPQSTWRPSDEQMKQLKSAADIYPDSRLGHGLKSLYQDLKKLREE